MGGGSRLSLRSLLPTARTSALCAATLMLMVHVYGAMLAAQQHKLHGDANMCRTLKRQLRLAPRGQEVSWAARQLGMSTTQGAAAAVYCSLPVRADVLLAFIITTWFWASLSPYVSTLLSLMGMDWLAELVDASAGGRYRRVSFSDMPPLDVVHDTDPDSEGACGDGDRPGPRAKEAGAGQLLERRAGPSTRVHTGAGATPPDALRDAHHGDLGPGDEWVYVGGAFGTLPRSVRDRWRAQEAGQLRGEACSGAGATATTGGGGTGMPRLRQRSSRELPPVRGRSAGPCTNGAAHGGGPACGGGAQGVAAAPCAASAGTGGGDSTAAARGARSSVVRANGAAAQGLRKRGRKAAAQAAACKPAIGSRCAAGNGAAAVHA